MGLVRLTLKMELRSFVAILTLDLCLLWWLPEETRKFDASVHRNDEEQKKKKKGKKEEEKGQQKNKEYKL